MLKAIKKGYCLDATNNKNKEGQEVLMSKCNSDNKNQQWQFTRATRQIKSVFSDNMCLDAKKRNKKGGKVGIPTPHT